VYIIALCNSLNTKTFFLFHVFFLVQPLPTLNKFVTKEHEQPKRPEPVPRVYDGKDWCTINRHLLACIKDKYSFDARVIRDTLHHLSI
jgi:hypothetical protein